MQRISCRTDTAPKRELTLEMIRYGTQQACAELQRRNGRSHDGRKRLGIECADGRPANIQVSAKDGGEFVIRVSFKLNAEKVLPQVVRKFIIWRGFALHLHRSSEAAILPLNELRSMRSEGAILGNPLPEKLDGAPDRIVDVGACRKHLQYIESCAAQCGRFS